MNANQGIVNHCCDAKHPHPTLLLLGKRMYGQERKRCTADPAKENVITIRIFWVECPEKHWCNNGLWYPDSFHLFASNVTHEAQVTAAFARLSLVALDAIVGHVVPCYLVCLRAPSKRPLPILPKTSPVFSLTLSMVLSTFPTR